MRAQACVLLAITALTLSLCGCASADRLYSQTELNALQTREYDAPFDATFDAALGALFDAGYTVSESDKDGGFLSAHRFFGSAWSGYSAARVQIKIDAMGAERSSVRVVTSDGLQSRVNVETIREIHTLIERRALLGAPGAAGAPGVGRP